MPILQLTLFLGKTSDDSRSMSIFDLLEFIVNEVCFTIKAFILRCQRVCHKISVFVCKVRVCAYAT